MRCLMEFFKKRYSAFKILIFSVICILTFCCVVPVSVSATGTNGDTSAVNNGETDTDYDNNALELSIGDINASLSTSGESSSLSSTLQILLVLTIISLAPSILIMLTSFTRIVIVLHFTRSALGTQTTPPNQIMIGLALFVTLFIMSPTFMAINKNAIQPYSADEISQEEALDVIEGEFRNFMFTQLGDNAKDLKLFLNIAGITDIQSRDDIPTTCLIPAFIISELRIAFIIGFLIYIPFLIIDMVVASTLMSMGMMMLPPTTISMPFKILLFIMADGWNLVIGRVVETFFR